MLNLNNVSLKANNKQILDGIDTTIGKGELVIIKGRDDSGKTTLLDVICGLIPDYEGGISLFGKELRDMSFEDTERVFPVPDNLLIEKRMTVSEFLSWNRERAPFYSPEIEASLIKRFGLDGRLKIKELDESSNKSLQLIPAFSSGADLILLDEPDNFLNEESLKKWERIIEASVYGGKTIIITTAGDSALKDFGGTLWTMSEGRRK